MIRHSALEEDLRAVFDRLEPGSRRLTVLTGAGISTECGVPDFRSPDSPWRHNKPIDYSAFMADPAARAEAWRRKFIMDDIYRGAQPGRVHVGLTRLAGDGRVRAVVTQNIDGLHQAAGLDPDDLIELHGNGTFARCLSCGQRYELVAIRQRFESGQIAPICLCGGFIKSATITFGQAIPRDTIDAAVRATLACDIFLVLGSSLVVKPASTLPLLAQKNGATLVVVNREPTPIDDAADHVVRCDVGDWVSSLVR